MDEYRKLTLARRAAIDEELRGYEIAMDQIAVKRSLALARLGELDWLLQAMPPALEHQPLGLGVPVTPVGSEPAPIGVATADQYFAPNGNTASPRETAAEAEERRGRRNIRGEVREAIGKAGARGITVEAITEYLVDARPVGITTALEYCSSHGEIVFHEGRWYLANMVPQRQGRGQTTDDAHPASNADIDIDPAASETGEWTLDPETGEIRYPEPAPIVEDTERRVPRPLPTKDGLFDPPEDTGEREAAE